MGSTALPPLDRWPEQLVDPRFGHAWFTAPAVFLNQLDVQRATLETVNVLHDAIDDVLAKRRPEIDAAGGLTIIHDWRQLQGYDSQARRTYLDRMRRREPGYLKLAVAVVRDSPLLRMAVQTGNMLMALRIGGRLELSLDLEDVLDKHGVQTPTPGWLTAPPR
jgi:hypothetical protein